LAYIPAMRKQVFTVRLDDDILNRLAAIAEQNRVSHGHVAREALRVQLGLDPPGRALAAALANADAPWLQNGQGEHG
jgi:predicted transcriptional regulator